MRLSIPTRTTSQFCSPCSLARSFNSMQDFGNLLNLNRFYRGQGGTGVQTFDWRKPSEIPRFFLGPLEPLEWHVVGAFALIHSLSENEHLGDLPFFSQDEKIGHCLSQTWLKSVLALLSLLKCSYWTRAWITQEIVLAHKPTIYYGPHIIDFRTLARAQIYFKRHFNQPCCAPSLGVHEMNPCEDSTIWGALSRSFQIIDDISDPWAMSLAERANGKEISSSWGNILATGLREPSGDRSEGSHLRNARGWWITKVPTSSKQTTMPALLPYLPKREAR